MRRFGFSTGALAMGDFSRALGMLHRFPEVSAVELSALRECELEPLVEAAQRLDVRQFKYVAVHALSKLKDEAQVVDLLSRLQPRGWPVILHPDAIQDASLWRRLGGSLCLENMDKRKPCGRSLKGLGVWFDRLPDAGFCLDLGHARQFDSSMVEAYLLATGLGSRLRQIHLSEVMTDSKHAHLSYTAAIAFKEVAPLIPDDIPVILESVVGEQEIEAELSCAKYALPPAPRRTGGPHFAAHVAQ